MTLDTTQMTSAQASSVQLSEVLASQSSLPAPKFEFVGDLADLSVAMKAEAFAAQSTCACGSGCSNCACGACDCTGCSGCSGTCGSCACTGR
jgi:hypothetical protein